MNKEKHRNEEQIIRLDTDFCRGVIECSKKCPQALVQVLYFEEIPRKEKGKPLRYNVAISDGFCYFRAAFCHEASRKIHDNHIAKFDIILVTKYLVSQLTSQGTTLVMITDYERKISGVKRIIGKPVYISDYKTAKYSNPFGSNTIEYENLFEDLKPSDITNDLYSQFLKATPLEITTTVSFHAETPNKDLASQSPKSATKKKVKSRRLSICNQETEGNPTQIENSKTPTPQKLEEEKSISLNLTNQEIIRTHAEKNEEYEYVSSYKRTTNLIQQDDVNTPEKEVEKKDGLSSTTRDSFPFRERSRLSQKLRGKNISCDKDVIPIIVEEDMNIGISSQSGDKKIIEVIKENPQEDSPFVRKLDLSKIDLNASKPTSCDKDLIANIFEEDKNTKLSSQTKGEKVLEIITEDQKEESPVARKIELSNIDLNNNPETPQKLDFSLAIEIEDYQEENQQYVSFFNSPKEEDREPEVIELRIVENKENPEVQPIKTCEDQPSNTKPPQEQNIKFSEFHREVKEDKILRQQQHQFLKYLKEKQQKERWSLQEAGYKPPAQPESKSNNKNSTPQHQISKETKRQSLPEHPQPSLQTENQRKIQMPVQTATIKPEESKAQHQLFMKPFTMISKDNLKRPSPLKLCPNYPLQRVDIRQNWAQEIQNLRAVQQNDKSLVLAPLDYTQSVKFKSQSSSNSGESQFQTQMIFPIKALSYLSTSWIIKARVTKKNPVRLLQTKSGKQTKFFSIEIIDKEGGEIEAVFFGSLCAAYFDKIYEKNVYLFSGGLIKKATIQQTASPNDIQIVFESQADIKEVKDDGTIPLNLFNFCSITDIQNKQIGDIVDIVGIVYQIGQIMEIPGKSKDKILKRSFFLYDKSCQTVEITIWGEFCKTQVQIDRMIIVKKVKVNQYLGKKSLVSSANTSLITKDFPNNIQEVEEVAKLLEKKALRAEVDKKCLQRYLIAEILEAQNNLNKAEKHYFDVTASIIHIQSDVLSTLYYLSCPKENCLKKVVEIGNTLWKCLNCHETTTSPKPRYTLSILISDFSGSLWINAFDMIGENIVGYSASYIQRLRESERDQDNIKFQKVITAPISKEYNMRIMAKYEEYKGREEWKFSILKINPLSYGAESRKMLQLLDLYHAKT